VAGTSISSATKCSAACPQIRCKRLITFLLSAPPFSYSAGTIGLVGLVGLSSALAAQRAGTLHDRGGWVPAIGPRWCSRAARSSSPRSVPKSILVVFAAVVLIDVAIQAVNVLNQTRLFAVGPNARSRLNTAFVTSNFIGGAIGSTLAGVLWQHGGWLAP
jgi:predicted MFS family arabinose efflux permease